METQNLRNALELLRSYALTSSKSETEYRCSMGIAEEAEGELGELRRLAEAVKGFIEDNGVTDEEALDWVESKHPYEFFVVLRKLCDIVGYNKE